MFPFRPHWANLNKAELVYWMTSSSFICKPTTWVTVELIQSLKKQQQQMFPFLITRNHREDVGLVCGLSVNQPQPHTHSDMKDTHQTSRKDQLWRRTNTCSHKTSIWSTEASGQQDEKHANNRLLALAQAGKKLPVYLFILGLKERENFLNYICSKLNKNCSFSFFFIL